MHITTVVMYYIINLYQMYDVILMALNSKKILSNCLATQAYVYGSSGCDDKNKTIYKYS